MYVFSKNPYCESHLPIKKSLYFLAHNVVFIYFFIYTCFFIYCCVNVTVLTRGNVQFQSPFVCNIWGKWGKNKVYWNYLIFVLLFANWNMFNNLMNVYIQHTGYFTPAMVNSVMLRINESSFYSTSSLIVITIRVTQNLPAGSGYDIFAKILNYVYTDRYNCVCIKSLRISETSVLFIPFWQI